MTAASKEQTWPQANSPHKFLGRTEFHFLEDQAPEYKCLGNCDKSEDPDSASSSSLVTYSLSDISLSSSSSGAAGSDVSHKTSSDLMFLPPSKTRHDKLVEGHSWGNETEKSLTCFPDCGSPNSHCFPFNDEKADDFGSSFICQSSSSHSQTSENAIFEFDVAGMREKLEAQKEYLLGSFNRQTCLPQALTTQPKYPRVEKPSSLKMKEKLHKVGRAARRFLSTRIFRRHPAVQRCEINLQGFDDTDSVERLILVVGQRRSVAETVHMSFPAFFETNRVTVPQFLLPIKSGETMTVSVYGVTGQASGQFPGFSEVLISGVCTVQSDTALLTGNLELQPHRPSHSLTGHNKGIQSCGSSLKMKHTHPDNYTFSTLPKPISKDFTELCVLQTAEPFREYFSLSTSTCDQPASFQAHMLPGMYHAACSFRLTHAPISGTYSLALATPTVFFKAYMDRAGVAGRLQAATELVQCHVGSVHGSAPQLLPSMQLFKPPGFDLEVLMKSLQARQTGKLSAVKPTDASQGTTEEGLHFCAWDMGTAMTSHHDATANTTTKSRFAVVNMGTVMTNPRLPPGNGECIPMPSLCVFNLGTQLYFADCWSYYDKHYVTLVLCSKGSPCQQVCKRYLCKLDPYNNPFLFRRRCFDPEPSIAVYASSRINVEVIYSNSAEIQQLISICSENVYFCKVQMANK